MAAHLTRSDCEGSNAVEGTNDDMLRNDSEGDGDGVRKVKALTMKMETMILIGEGR